VEQQGSGRAVVPASGTPTAPAGEEVRAGLARVLASPPFAASAHLRGFLAFVVEAALAGDGKRITAYRIGAEALRRGERFDPATDPIVRIEATKLRRALERYYLTLGQDDPVRIGIATGGYVPTFRVRAPPPAVTPEPSPPAEVPRPRLRPPPPVIAVPALILLLVVAGGLWRSNVSSEPAAPRHVGVTGPALLVLPLQSPPGSEDERALAEGLTDQLITDLLRFPQFRLFSRTASFAQPADAAPGDLRRELEVDYVVKGSLRATASGLHLTASLTDARTGEIVWSHGYDRELTATASVAVQEDVAGSVAAHLGGPDGAVNAAMGDIPAGAAPESLSSYLCVLKGYAYRRSGQLARQPEAEACLAEAVRRDPSYPEAWAMLAIVGLDRYRWGDRVGVSAGPIVASAGEAAARALELAPRNTLVLEAASAVRFHEGDTAEAERLIRQAVALNPDNPETLALLGVRVALPGRWEEGLGYLDRAVDRTLRPPTWLLVARAMARYMLGDFRGALPDAEDGQGCCAGMGMVLLAAVRGQLGDGEAAHAALAVALARSPVLGRDPRAFLAPWQLREADVARLLDGLRRAGLGGTSS